MSVHEVTSHFQQMVAGVAHRSVVVTVVEIELAYFEKIASAIILVSTLFPPATMFELEPTKLWGGVPLVEVIKPEIVVPLRDVPLLAPNRIQLTVDYVEVEIDIVDFLGEPSLDNINRKGLIAGVGLTPNARLGPLADITKVDKLRGLDNINGPQYTLERRPVVHGKMLVGDNQRTFYGVFTQVAFPCKIFSSIIMIRVAMCPGIGNLLSWSFLAPTSFHSL